MKDKKIALTDELYRQISKDKMEKIVEYKNKKDQMQKSAQEEIEIIAELKAERDKIDEAIAESKSNLKMSRIINFIFNMKLLRQRKLSTKIDKKFSKGVSTIKLNRYYPEIKTSKKR